VTAGVSHASHIFMRGYLWETRSTDPLLALRAGRYRDLGQLLSSAALCGDAIFLQSGSGLGPQDGRPEPADHLLAFVGLSGSFLALVHPLCVVVFVLLLLLEKHSLNTPSS
jgi:hypothetical protein